MSRRFGLIGKGISYSLSPEIWRDIWHREEISDSTFEVIDTDSPHQIIERFRSDSSWKGLMVTAPYKESIIPFLDDLSPEAQQIGAVNTIAKVNDQLIGFNTDAAGFLAPLISYNLEGNALVLGSGGASRAVRYALESIGMKVVVVSRFPKGQEISYRDVTSSFLSSFRLIVNATPLGGPRFPNEYPDIPYLSLGAEHILYDLSYSLPIKFLSMAPNDCVKITGEVMLRGQAEEANKIFQFLCK